MDNHSVCHDPSVSESSLNELQALQAFQTGPSVVSASLRELISAYGLLPVLRSQYARCLYIARLWLLRELSIFVVLTVNYEKVPPRTLSKLLVSVPYYLKPARRLNARLLAALKKRVITSPYQVTRTANN